MKESNFQLHHFVTLSYIFGDLIRRVNSLEKTLMLGKFEGRRRGDDRGWDGWMASLTQWTWVWANSGRSWRTGEPGVLQSMGSQRVRHNLANEQQQSYILKQWSAYVPWCQPLGQCAYKLHLLGWKLTEDRATFVGSSNSYKISKISKWVCNRKIVGLRFV